MATDNRGGKRAGARHPPGANFGRDLPGPAAVTVTQPRPPTVRIHAGDPALTRVLELRALGHPWRAIERMTGRDMDTCQRWVAAYPELALAEVRRLTDPVAFLEPMIPKAAATYHEVLDSTDPRQLPLRAQVAQDVFDRRFGKPTIRQESVSLQGIVIEVRSHSD